MSRHSSSRPTEDKHIVTDSQDLYTHDVLESPMAKNEDTHTTIISYALPASQIAEQHIPAEVKDVRRDFKQYGEMLLAQWTVDVQIDPRVPFLMRRNSISSLILHGLRNLPSGDYYGVRPFISEKTQRISRKHMKGMGWRPIGYDDEKINKIEEGMEKRAGDGISSGGVLGGALTEGMTEDDLPLNRRASLWDYSDAELEAHLRFRRQVYMRDARP